MGDPGSTPAYYSARPSIRLNGREHPGLTEGLLNLFVEETTAGLYRCEATFSNWGSTGRTVDFLYFDRRTLDFGTPFSVQAGSGQAEAVLFEGRITGLEAHYPHDRPPEVVVLAEDRFQDLRMTRRTQTYEQVSDRDVIGQIAGRHSLRPVLDVDGPTHRILAQVNQSDLAFLRERARAIDAEVWVEGTALHAQARARRNQGDVTLTYGEGLRAFSVLADLARQRTSLTVNGWDVETKQSLSFEAAEATLRSELNGHLSGPQALQQAFGTRAERLVHMVPFSQDEARHLAEAHYRRLARRFLTGQGLTQGDGRLRVGTYVDLQDLGPLFEGKYYVTEVRHTFDLNHGFQTAFCVERPGLGTA